MIAHDVPGQYFVRPGFGDAPVGSVLAFAGKLNASDSSSSDGDHVTAPLEAWGWMYCDGRTLGTGAYPELFAVLGYLYGGSGSDFKIPDLRGYFLRGNGDGTNNDPDIGERTLATGEPGLARGVGSIQQSALQSHEHTYSSAPAPSAQSPSGTAAGAPSVASTLTIGGPVKGPKQSSAVLVSQYESRPINVCVNYIIKFTYGLAPLSREAITATGAINQRR